MRDELCEAISLVANRPGFGGAGGLPPVLLSGAGGVGVGRDLSTPHCAALHAKESDSNRIVACLVRSVVADSGPLRKEAIRSVHGGLDGPGRLRTPASSDVHADAEGAGDGL